MAYWSLFTFKIFLCASFVGLIYTFNFIRINYFTSVSTFFLNFLDINKLRSVTRELQYLLILNLSFLPKYYSRNELVWGDGFLIDFLQKKSVDIWLRKFVIYTGFIFSERLVFDQVVRFYLDNLLWPLHYIGIFESNNIIETLSAVIFLYFFIFSLLFFAFIVLI